MATNVLGVAITNQSMVPVAKKVGTSAMILVGWSLCVGIVTAIATSLTVGKVPDLIKMSCEDSSVEHNSLCEEGVKQYLENLGSPVTIVFQVAAPVIVPCLLLLCVRSGLQGNNKGCLQMACVTQGIGACCSCISAVSMCILVVIVMAAASTVSNADCSGPACEGIKSVGGKVTAYVLVCLCVQIGSMCVCGYAAMSAKAASGALDSGPFAGSPPPGMELVGEPARS